MMFNTKKKSTQKLLILLIATLSICSASTCARTIYIDANGTGDYPTIQAAINDGNGGDVVVLSPGIYIGDGNRDINFNGKAMTLRSIDPKIKQHFFCKFFFLLN